MWSSSSSSSSSCRDFFSRYGWKIGALLYVVLGIIVPIVAGNYFVAIIWFVGVPFVILGVRYLWLRLCRDPFLSPSDSFRRIFWESITTCPPDIQRTVPTIIFVVLIALVIIGSVVARAGLEELNPSWFIIFAYNGLGALLILVCAVWCVDFLWLCWLLLIGGKKGAAKNWWWKNNLRRMDEEQHEKNKIQNPDSPNNQTTEVAATTTAASDDNNGEEATSSNEKDDDGDDTIAKSKELDRDRRWAKIRAVLILLFFIWWTAWSLVAAYNPHILKLSVPVPKLPPQCDGYRLAVATDLHAGSLSGVKETEWMVQLLNNLNPDAIALGGDMGDEPVDDVLRKKLEPLAQLTAPDGVYYSFGNHENIQGIEGYRKLFRTESPFKENIITLENEHVIINRLGSGGGGGGGDGGSEGEAFCHIAIIGLADWSGRGSSSTYKGQVAPDFYKAIRYNPDRRNGGSRESDRPVPSSLPMIMMQHQPADIMYAARNGVGLQLSGHTHGGQIWPQHMLLANFDAISGLHAFDVGSEDGPSYLFVSEGVVGWGPRLRFLCKTDVALLTLRNPEAMAAEGLVPDTDLTIATFGMYLALALVPLGLLACFIPVICWAKKRVEYRRQNSKKDDDDDVASSSAKEKDVEEKAESDASEKV